MTEEIWKVPEGFGSYEVSSHGRVRRKVASRVHPAGYLLKGDVTKNGYRRVELSANGEKHRVHVNRLVCEVFHGPAPSKTHQAAHLNGVRSDNRANNLAWKTISENHADKRSHGTWQGGENHNQAIMTEEDIRQIMTMRVSIRGGVNKRGSFAIAKETGLPRHAIQAVICGRTWTHITGGAI